MPFIERPQGFSADTLALLDRAMSELWLEHTALAPLIAAPKETTPHQPATPPVASDLTK